MGISMPRPELPLDAVKVTVVALSGSLREGSYTTMALRTALRGAAEAGANVRLIDLREYELAFAMGEHHANVSSSLDKLRTEVQAAHGILIGTPEYHGSFSGVVKNALDLMGFDEFEGKMIGLVGVSAGRMGAFDALNSLRNVGRALHAWVVPEQVSIPEAWKVFDEAGAIHDAQIEQRLLQVGRRVAEFARLHECGRAQEFVESWEGAMENPGG